MVSVLRLSLNIYVVKLFANKNLCSEICLRVDFSFKMLDSFLNLFPLFPFWIFAKSPPAAGTFIQGLYKNLISMTYLNGTL